MHQRLRLRGVVPPRSGREGRPRLRHLRRRLGRTHDGARLVELGDRVALDNCSVVAHINSRGKFSLNRLTIGSSAALRSGSRLLSGANMEEGSMLLEHTLLTSGEIAESGGVYAGWPARLLEGEKGSHRQSSYQLMSALHLSSRYRKLQRATRDMRDEKRRLDEKLELGQRQLREARRQLEGMLPVRSHSSSEASEA
ncbi:uncharacterized protein BXZ73DRAFT_80202 [Epithele typhae]|uniref:uncharacterized protein n=1 Tax=Epithele typhae TaxID=378194 RepID=UPI002007228A|nr:uncharacterized protein BXZ73DRAFT_80202 [Epithele typhae]KAH9920262.1 hypothetical protein BXZ73DRAFT_80202 [Epithele typhae]